MTSEAAKARDRRASTGADAVCCALRRAILDGVLAPGSKLRSGELMRRHRVGARALREALALLVDEALATDEGKSGFRVAAVSLDDFRDLSDTLELVETAALKLAIADGDETWEAGIVAAAYRLSKAAERLAASGGIGAEWATREREFHVALIAACPLRWLKQIAHLLLLHRERYNRIALTRGVAPIEADDDGRAILDAVLARNADLACRAIADRANASCAAVARMFDAAR